MTVTAITMMRNEADLVGAFVTYHVPLVDRHVIIDVGSTDGTRDLLVELADQIASLQVRFATMVAFEQSDVMTRLALEAVEDPDVDLVLPLDADEFLAAASGPIDITWAASLPRDRVTQVPWSTYLPCEDPDDRRSFPAVMAYRRADEGGRNLNVIVPRNIVLGPGFRLTQGNHRVEQDQARPPDQVCDALRLIHLPIRSANQALKKYLVGWLSHLGRRDSVLFDWAPYYHRLKYECAPSLELLTQLAFGYDADSPTGEIFDPIDLSHCGDLPGPSGDRSAALCVLDYAESLALAFSEAANPPRGEVGCGSAPPRVSRAGVLDTVMRYRLFPGWLSDREAAGLYEALLGCGATSPTVVELGTWHGRSAYVLGSALNALGSGALHCVDLFDGTGDELSERMYTEFRTGRSEENASAVRNRLKHELPAVDIHVHATRSDAAPGWLSEPPSVDFLLLDASHDEASVRSDWQTWEPLLAVGARAAFHDVGSAAHRGPREVLEKEVLASGSWKMILYVDELLVVERVR